MSDSSEATNQTPPDENSGQDPVTEVIEKKEFPKMLPISVARIGLVVEKRNDWLVNVPTGTLPEQALQEDVWVHLTNKLRKDDQIHVLPDDSEWEMVLGVQAVGKTYAHVVMKDFYKLGARERGVALPSIYKIEYAGSTYLWRVIRGDKLLRDGFQSESLARRYAANHEAAELSLYNGALRELGERKLQTLTDNVESRKKLDEIWDNDLVDRVLKKGQWDFAGRTIQLEATPSITPGFGYQFGFDRPLDYIRLLEIASDEYFSHPLTSYSVEAAWWFTDIETIYIKYVSNDSQWGGDFSLWPEDFTEYVEFYMAGKVAPRLLGLRHDSAKFDEKIKKALLEAKGGDVMEQPAKFAPKGGWARSKQGFRSGTTDRGNRSKLIG